jgi:predicted histone-like DNA-binding protein
MKYKLIERKNPLNKEEKQGKWYASPVNEGKVTQKMIASDIVDLSSLSRGDVASVIENLLDTVPKYLLMGKSVNLGSLGTMRLSFSSKGAEKPEEFNSSFIKNVKVVFTPSTDFKAVINKISFEKSK